MQRCSLLILTLSKIKTTNFGFTASANQMQERVFMQTVIIVSEYEKSKACESRSKTVDEILPHCII